MKTPKKRILVLPENFQEILISHEIKFERGEIDILIIKKLIYLYSVNIQ
jgi:hypothetical protein